MWQGFASDGVAKQGRPATQAFMQAYLECVSFYYYFMQKKKFRVNDRLYIRDFLFL